MREIKYRAWDTVQEKILPVEAINFREDLVTLDEGDNSVSDSKEMFILMQYTGLKDRNGKEIYEGDIINDSFGNRKGVIKYNPYIAAYELTDYDGIHLLSSGNSKQFFEVIGDIWSNPDLLGEVRGNG